MFRQTNWQPFDGDRHAVIDRFPLGFIVSIKLQGANLSKTHAKHNWWAFWIIGSIWTNVRHVLHCTGNTQYWTTTASTNCWVARSILFVMKRWVFFCIKSNAVSKASSNLSSEKMSAAFFELSSVASVWHMVGFLPSYLDGSQKFLIDHPPGTDTMTMTSPYVFVIDLLNVISDVASWQ